MLKRTVCIAYLALLNHPHIFAMKVQDTDNHWKEMGGELAALPEVGNYSDLRLLPSSSAPSPFSPIAQGTWAEQFNTMSGKLDAIANENKTLLTIANDLATENNKLSERVDALENRHQLSTSIGYVSLAAVCIAPFYFVFKR